MSDVNARTRDAQQSELSHSHGPLLLSKLQAPRKVYDHLLRPRLIKLIEQGVDRKLTLVISPPGYGKSTLVGQWMHQSDRLSAWLSLDEADNDFLRFLEYVVAAIRSLDPSLCLETMALLHSPDTPPTRQLIHTLVNETAAATRQFVLVLDDYHLITSLEVQGALTQIIQEMPVNMAVVIVSRQDPNLPTLRMEARGELLALGIQDLRFTADETAEFLIDRHGLILEREEIAKIDQWAEGWPVAIRLLSSVMRGKSQQDIELLLTSLADNVPTISSYLWDEIIGAQPDIRRRLLLETSILQQFNPELCASVTEIPDVAEQLIGLERDNLLITRLNGPGNWYRYHHLFAEALSQRLASEAGPERTKELHTRAAIWFDDRHFVPEAAHHAIKAQQWELASRLLVQICQELYENERVGNLHTWLKDLPDEPLMFDPRLAYWLAWAQVRTGYGREASHAIAIAEEAARARPSPYASMAASQVHVLKSLFAADVSEGEAAAEQLMQRLGTEEDGDRARLLIMLGLLQQTGGDFSESERSLEQARSLIDRIGIRGLHVAELVATASLERAMGLLKEPAELFRRAIAIGDEWNDLPLQNSQHSLGEIHYEWNRMDEAYDRAEITERLIRQMGAKLHHAPVCLLKARIAAASGQWDAAFDEVERAIAASSPAGYTRVIPSLEELKCRLWLATDQLTLAQGWLQFIGEDAIHTSKYQEIPTALTGIRVRIQEGRANEMLQPLARLAELARNQGWNRVLLSVQTLHAIAALDVDHSLCALGAIEEALRLGVDEGFVRTFLDEGSRLHPVLELAAGSEGQHRAYASALLEAAGVKAPAALAAIDTTPSILSPRERDVMRLVAGGLSNREVGDALFISEETVKTHLRRIFEKLEVSSRTQAIFRSQQLDLL